MSLTLSTMMALGTAAPDFTLPDTISGENLSLTELRSEVATVVIFICNHCPFVHHINPALVAIAEKYQSQGIQFIAISSNAVEDYPQDSPELMKETALREGYTFPYLYDATQEVAKAYNAVCTPDLFVFNEQLSCVYRGRFDDTRPNLGISTGKDLSAALNAVISGETVNSLQHPSMGCNIKWR
ncbi:thioredoxin family protein [Lacinutrix undariae]